MRRRLSQPERQRLRALYATGRYTHRGLARRFRVGVATSVGVVHEDDPLSSLLGAASALGAEARGVCALFGVRP